MSKLDAIVNEIRFNKISSLHILVALPLLITIYGLSKIYYLIQENGLGVVEQLDFTTTAFLGFYGVYLVASSFSIYRLYSELIDHIVYSNIVLYHWCKDIECNYSSLLRTGLERKKIPAPVTALLINVITGGLTYPILLGLFEKYITIHWSSEEKTLFNRSSMREKTFASIVFDLAFLILTLGLYLVYWILRSIRTFNKHVDTIHAKHPYPPQSYVREGGVKERGLITILGLMLFFTGLYSLVSYIAPWLSVVAVIGFGLLIPYVAFISRKTSIIRQSLILLCFEYILIALMGFIGLTSYHYHSVVLESFKEQTKEIVVSNNVVDVLAMIFLNNVKITVASLVPVIGMVYAGYALSQTGFIYGLILGSLLEKSLSQALTGLLVLVLPHAPLELYSYALALSIGSRVGIEKSYRLAIKTAISIIILLIAAYIEALLITNIRITP